MEQISYLQSLLARNKDMYFRWNPTEDHCIHLPIATSVLQEDASRPWDTHQHNKWCLLLNGLLALESKGDKIVILYDYCALASIIDGNAM